MKTLLQLYLKDLSFLIKLFICIAIESLLDQDNGLDIKSNQKEILSSLLFLIITFV